jgi:hypothetical protein
VIDPTIYDNLKVVLEGLIYDIDLAGSVTVTDRKDLVDLSSMSRAYVIRFELNSRPHVSAEIHLSASLKDLSIEILEQEDIEKAGCELTIHLFTSLRDDKACDTIHQQLSRIWDGRPRIEQTLSYVYDRSQQRPYLNQITLSFARKINEQHVMDLPQMIETLVQSLEGLTAD